MNASGVGPVLARLRAGTQKLHQALEQTPAFGALLADDLTIESYAAALLCLHGFHAVVEPALAGILGVSDTRLLLLTEDLAWLGIGVAALPPPALSRLPTERLAALGWLYVVEGSRLGGRVIARHLADRLNLAPGRGAAYYGSTDADAMRRIWRTLCLDLETAGQADEAAETILSGAQSGFIALTHLAQLQPDPPISIRMGQMPAA